MPEKNEKNSWWESSLVLILVFLISGQYVYVWFEKFGQIIQSMALGVFFILTMLSFVYALRKKYQTGRHCKNEPYETSRNNEEYSWGDSFLNLLFIMSFGGFIVYDGFDNFGQTIQRTVLALFFVIAMLGFVFYIRKKRRTGRMCGDEQYEVSKDDEAYSWVKCSLILPLLMSFGSTIIDDYFRGSGQNIQRIALAVFLVIILLGFVYFLIEKYRSDCNDRVEQPGVSGNEELDSNRLNE